ncbi:MAG: hypothetical protein RL398_2702 [Planctomycetota bacterium]|jgi:protoporphyrinogen oxidase
MNDHQPPSEPPLHLAVVGAGRRGLLTALAARKSFAAHEFALLDAAPQPGGDDLTRRSNGFGCELGAIGLWPDELAAFAEHLAPLPPRLALDPAAANGALWDGERLHPCPVDPAPATFRGGLEDLWQAARRALGPALRLGRKVTTAARTQDGWELHLGGEVPTVVAARELTLALPVDAAVELLAPYDPALGEVAARLRRRTQALVYLGDRSEAGAAVPGYGIAAHPDLPDPLREVVHCSRAFAPRAMAGRCLLRCELVLDEAEPSDERLVGLARERLAAWLGSPLPDFGFTLVHRRAELVRDGAYAECKLRLQALPDRVGSLRLA